MGQIKQQKGFALFMAMMMLVLISIAAVAMFNTSSSGVVSSGNIAFRQAASKAAEVAVEDARTWLSGQSADYLSTDNAGDGYISSITAPFDFKTFDFEANGRTVMYNGAVDNISGYTAHYITHRLAKVSGEPCTSVTAGCVFPDVAASSSGTDGSSRVGGGNYSGVISGAVGLVYYRVTVKVTGPKHNTRYVQVFFY